MTEEVSINKHEAPQENQAEIKREADRSFHNGNWEEARDFYLKIFEQEKNNAEVCERLIKIYAILGLISDVLFQNYQLVRILDANGYPDKALHAADRALSLNPEYEAIRKKIIMIYMRKEDKKGFERETLDLAHLYLEKGYEDHSLMLIRKLIEIFPDRPELELHLAHTHVKLGNIREAADHYRNVANFFLEKGMKQEACEAFKKIKVLGKPDFLLLITLGDLYLELGDYDAAEEEYRAALKIEIDSVEALSGLGNTCIEKGCYLVGITAYNKILKINPHNIQSKEGLAKLFVLTNDTAQAIRYYLEIAMHYSASDDPGSARIYLKKVLELDPLNQMALKEVEKLEKELHKK